MSFPRYPEYKDSGVEWLGEIPAHWDVLALKRDLSFLTSGSRGWAEHYADEGAVFIRIGNLTRDRISLDLSDIQYVDIPDGAEGERTKVQPGDVLFSITAYLGSVAVVPNDLHDAYVSQHVALARISGRRFLSEWVAYSALSIVGKTYLETQGYGGTKIQLGLDDIANLIVLVPSISEQRTITDFIGRERAKIDALIAEQEHLIALLKEKRQAVIFHAVTKGLNPDVPMRESGVEWLGQVPAHWIIAPVAARYEVQLGKMLDSSRIVGEHLRPYLRVYDVQWGRVNTEDLPRMDFDEKDREKFCLKTGDLLVNEGGSYVGRSAIWNGDISECYYQKALHRLRPRSNEDITEFFYFIMFFATHLGVFTANGNQATIDHLTAESLRRYRFAFPPQSEQIAIASYLNAEIGRLDAVVSAAENAITLLQERRSALISAAVTGKIDVRGLVKAQEKAA